VFTSPHLVHFCERIRIAGEPIAEERAAELLEEIVRRVPWALRDDGLTFFELATAMAFLAFAQERVQLAVVEVGLGGRLDATNVVEPLACAVTPIGLDHVQWLGPTLAHVAAEKAGIFKRGAPAVSAGQPRAAADVLAQRAGELGIPLWRPGRDYLYESSDVRPFCYSGPEGFVVSLNDREEVVGDDERTRTARDQFVTQSVSNSSRDELAIELIPRGRGSARLFRSGSATGGGSGGLALLGHYQRANAALACALLQVAAGRGIPVTPEHVREGLRTARWPGRLEIVARKPLVVVDGAHNPHAAHAVARALPGIGEGRQVQLVFAAMNDKDHAGMLRELLPLAGGAHFCAVESPRAAAPEQLARVARELWASRSESGTRERGAQEDRARGSGAQICARYASVGEAVRAARAAAGEGGAVLCCGSLYLAAEVDAALRGRPAARMPSERL
jgi:dihydrofolate synthase / folylpolyglutamate synthase